MNFVRSVHSYKIDDSPPEGATEKLKSSSISAPLAHRGEAEALRMLQGGEGDCHTVTACACLSASGALLRLLLGLDAACTAPSRRPYPLSLDGARGTEV